MIGRMNPVYGKEIKLRVRTVKFAITVMLYNAILAAIALLFFYVSFNASVFQLDYRNATYLYVLIVVLEGVLLAFLIPAFTAGSIAGEREKQTLDILLTTKLRPGQIIFGKLASSISMILLLVVSSLPVLSIVFSIGGVGWQSLLQFIVLVLVTGIYFGSFGMFFSTFFKKSVPATVFTYGSVLFLTGLTFVIVGVAYTLMNMNDYTTTKGIGPIILILLFNPVMTMIKMFANQFGGTAIFFNELMDIGKCPAFIEDYWFSVSLVIQFLISILMLHLAARRLDPMKRRRRS